MVDQRCIEVPDPFKPPYAMETAKEIPDSIMANDQPIFNDSSLISSLLDVGSHLGINDGIGMAVQEN